MNTQQRRADRLSRLQQEVDLRWWLVPLALALLTVAAALSWPQLSIRPDATASPAGQTQIRQQRTEPSTGASAAYAAATSPEEVQEDNHAPTF